MKTENELEEILKKIYDQIYSKHLNYMVAFTKDFVLLAMKEYAKIKCKEQQKLAIEYLYNVGQTKFLTTPENMPYPNLQMENIIVKITRTWSDKLDKPTICWVKCPISKSDDEIYTDEEKDAFVFINDAPILTSIYKQDVINRGLNKYGLEVIDKIEHIKVDREMSFERN